MGGAEELEREVNKRIKVNGMVNQKGDGARR